MNIFGKQIKTLDIESDCIRILTARGDKINKFGEAPVPPGLIKNTLIHDPEGVASIITGLCKEVGMSRSNVSIAVSDFRSVFRFVKLPKLESRQMEEAVMWAAEREMPVPLDTLYIIWQVLEKTDTEQRVFILGIPRDSFDQLMKTLSNAGISTRVIDSKALASGRLAGPNNAIIAHLENETISIVIKENGIPAVMHTVLVNPENAEIEDRIQRLSDDLFRTIEFYNNSHPGEPVRPETPLYLSGGVVRDTIPEMVRERINRPVELPDVALTLPAGLSVPAYAVNIGLVLRELKAGERKQRAGTYTLKPDIKKAKRFRI
jgi:type IV pilus assembly protein PilM